MGRSDRRHGWTILPLDVTFHWHNSLRLFPGDAACDRQSQALPCSAPQA